MQKPETATPPIDLIDEAASVSEMLRGPLDISDIPNTTAIIQVLSEMVGFDITDLWDAVMGDTP